jgi:murein DD-endopeptidase MepM/ murein hydrolase activator NlpD
MTLRVLGVALLAPLLLVACAKPPTSYPSRTQVHIVRKGETLWSISQRYGTSVDAVALANRISDPTQIRIGQRLVVPSGRRALRKRSGNTWTSSDPRGRSARHVFDWPTRGRVTSGFGMRNGAHHDGIDISAREGTAVRAAESGRVIHSDDRLSGYGNLIIIKHAGLLSSVYAHNRRNLVKVGEFVEKGQVIAEVGQTGRVSAPHLHFEVRRNGKAVNPLSYLK